MIEVKLEITAYPTPQKFELYEWLRQQGWRADVDYWMSFHNIVGKTNSLGDLVPFINLIFSDHHKAMIAKLAWAGTCDSF